MGNDDKVLSQAEIDALLSSNVSKAPPANAAPATATQQVKISAAPPPSKVVAQQPKATAVPVKPVVSVPPPVDAPPPATASTPAAAASGPTSEQVASLCRQIIAQETRDLQKTLQDLQKSEIELTVKVNKINTAGQKMDQLEEKIEQLAALVKSSPKAVKVLGARIDEIYGLLETMRQDTDEDRIHEGFHCVNCHSKKLVAVHVKCTSCGMENWMGWFPESKDNGAGHH